jgi:hypothetical protein
MDLRCPAQRAPPSAPPGHSALPRHGVLARHRSDRKAHAIGMVRTGRSPERSCRPDQRRSGRIERGADRSADGTREVVRRYASGSKWRSAARIPARADANALDLFATSCAAKAVGGDSPARVPPSKENAGRGRAGMPLPSAAIGHDHQGDDREDRRVDPHEEGEQPMSPSAERPKGLPAFATSKSRTKSGLRQPDFTGRGAPAHIQAFAAGAPSRHRVFRRDRYGMPCSKLRARPPARDCKARVAAVSGNATPVLVTSVPCRPGRRDCAHPLCVARTFPMSALATAAGIRDDVRSEP